MKASELLPYLQEALKEDGDIEVFIGNNFASTSWAGIQEYWQTENGDCKTKKGVFIYFDPETADKTGGEA